MALGPWFRRFQPTVAPAHRLVCFPHAGGAASFFVPTAQALACVADVLAVQYPGRHERLAEPCLTDVGALADAVHAAMIGWPETPLTLFGHSMGAVVAYEVARRLHRAQPGAALHLVVSGRRAPHLLRDDPRLDDDEGLLSHVRALGGTADDLLDDADMRELILPALRADYQAVSAYEWVADGHPQPCSITALTGDQDPYARSFDVAAWRQHSRDPFTLEVLPGGHFYLVDQTAAVYRILRDRLTRTL
ncbi:thioesterase II family protein [Micromonospora sp. NPDC050276]|uniref:thioesterase II family protein n=1 Tax=Micromonospora sp. NPDC050276 TaxID=3364278 RepID=UPI0037AB1353